MSRHYAGLGLIADVGKHYTFSVTISQETGGTPYVQLLTSTAQFGLDYYNINIITGNVVSVGGAALFGDVTIEPDPLTPGGFRLTITKTALVSGVGEFLFSFIPAFDSVRIPAFTADSNYHRLGVHRVQVVEGDQQKPYQSVGSNFNITETNVPSIHYLHFDGTDDLVSTTLPAITDGTLVIAGTNGIWIDDGFNFEGGAFEIGPTSYTNGPEGILPVIGDLIVGGTFVIDRQLTSDERAKVVRKMKSMGSPGLFRLGPELVINGDFSDGLNGWTLLGAANPDDVQVIDNQLVVIGPTASNFNLYNVMDTEPPGQYIIAGERIASEYNGGARIRPTPGDVSLSLDLNVQGAFLSRVVDIESSARLQFQVTSVGNAGGTFDNLSMRRLELVP